MSSRGLFDEDMFTGLVGAVSENKRAENPDEEMTLDD